MRRFVGSISGKIAGHGIALAMVMPYMALGVMATSQAQLQSKPAWAVVDLINLKSPGTNFGTEAAKALTTSLSKGNRYDVQQSGTVQRTVDTLGFVQPMTNIGNVLAVAREMKLGSVMTGEIVDYRVDSSPAGKQARVSMRVFVYDVASELTVNGAAVSGSSPVRGKEVSDESLVNDAITQLADVAINRINEQTLPTGTIQNTVERQAIINQGSRSGFAVGTRVVILRGSQQVGSGVISEVEPTRSYVKIERSILGAAPGDKVRAIFDVPRLVAGFAADGSTVTVRPPKRSNASSATSTLIVLALLAFVVGGSSGRGGSAVDNVVAEAIDDPTNGPGVRISWIPNAFVKGNQSRISWQAYRNDRTDAPIRIFSPQFLNGIDSNQAVATLTYTNLPLNAPLTTCSTNLNNGTVTGSTGAIPGRPYQYSIQLIYGIRQSDLPGQTGGGNTAGGTGGITAGQTAGSTGGVTAGGTAGGTGGTTATTGTTGTTGVTAGGTTGGTTTTGTTATTGETNGGGGTGTVTGLCYFASAQTPARGLATALTKPQLTSPATNNTLVTPQVFSFQSVVNPIYDITVEYILQVSSTPNFQAGSYFEQVLFARRDQGTLASQPVNLTTGSGLPFSFSGASLLYWRIGAKNVLDSPGPVPDSFTGKRYIFSSINQLNKPVVPPPPPL